MHGEATATQAPLGTVLLLGSLMAFGPLSIDMYLPAFPAMAREFGATPAEVQRTLSLYFAGLAVGQLLYGPLADRFGRRAPLLGGMLLYVVAAVGCATADSLAALSAWRFVQALGGCAGMVITRAVVRDRFAPKEMARVFSQLLLVMGVAPIIAPLLGSSLLELFGWRGIFWTLVILGVACVSALAALLTESLPPDRRIAAGPRAIVHTYRSLITDPRFLAPVLGGGLLWCTLYVYIGGAPFLYMELHAVTPSRFGLFFGLNAAGLIGVAQVNARLLRTRSTAALLRTGTLMVSAGALLLAVAVFFGWGGLIGVAVPIFIMLSGLGFVGANVSAIALAPFARAAGSASALMGTVQFTIGAACGALASALFDGTGVALTVVMAVAAVLGSAICVGFRVGAEQE